MIKGRQPRKAENIKAYSKKRLREVGGGRKATLKTGSDKLFFILFYYKTYPTFRFASFLYEPDKRNVQLWVRFLAPLLLHLPDNATGIAAIYNFTRPPT